MINHPLVEELKAKLDVTYNFYFEGLEGVKQLLKARGYSYEEELPFVEPETFHKWTKNQNRKDYILTITKEIFEKEDRLKFIRKSDWSDEYVTLAVVEKNEGDDLPF